MTAPRPVEIISQSRTQVGPVTVTFTVGRIPPKGERPRPAPQAPATAETKD